MLADTEKGPPYLGRRLVIFIVLGVPLGSMLLLLALPLAMNGNLDLGAAFADPAGLPRLVLLPPFWALGALPALVCGSIDARLTQIPLAPPLRALSTGCVAALLTLLPVFGFYASGLIRGLLPLWVGLAGFIAAAACSVLSALIDWISYWRASRRNGPGNARS
jgi:hypothetical protein